jgi:hypothetical protein
MPMTLRSERVGEAMALPTEVLSAIADVVKKRPGSDIPAIVSEVVETLAGKDPDKIVALIKSAGGAKGFVDAIVTEARRLRSLKQPKS